MLLHVCRPLAFALIVGVAIAPAATAHANEADDQYAVAAGHYDRQQWKPAVEEFQTFLQKYSSDARANRCEFFLGEALLQLGKLDDAHQHFRKYLAAEPKGEHAKPALFRSGEAAYLVGKFAAAKPDLDAFLAKYPDDRLLANVLPYLGEIALADGDAVAAAKRFGEGLKQFPEGRMQDDCRLGLGRALEKQNRIEEAERLYLLVAGKPGSPLADAAQFQLGALQYAAGRYDDALKSFSAFEDRPATNSWQPDARRGLGLTLLKLNRPAEAIKQFDAVLATPSVAEVLCQQALCGKVQAAMQAKDYAGVDREAADFEKRFPKSNIGADVRHMLARSLVERKQYARVVALLQPLASDKPSGLSDVENQYLLAVSYEGLKRYEEALAVVRPVVELAQGPLKVDAQLTLGSLLLALKKYPEAIAPLEAVRQAKPTDDAAVKTLGELAVCYARNGQLDKAKKVFEELVARYPQHALVAPTTALLADAAFDANDTAWSAELSGRLTAVGVTDAYRLKGKLGLGWSQFKAGKLAEAAATFDEVLKADPPADIAAEASLVRGQILEQLGQQKSALTMYDLLIEKYPASQQHADALLAAARLHDKLKQHQQAAALLERLAKDYPKFPRLDVVLYEWAWALQELKQPDEASRLFERLRKEYPQSRFAADVACRLAQRAFDAKDYDRAATLLDGVLNDKAAIADHAIPVDPNVREYAVFLRGQVCAAKNDWPKARESFEALLKEFPKTQRRFVAEFWIAESYYRQEDYAAADPLLEQLVKQIPANRETWMAMIPLRRAQMLARQNKWDEAQAMAIKIGGDFPSFEQQYEVDYLLGRCLAMQADFDGARKAYRQVINSSGGAKTETAAMAQWMIGETYFLQKSYKAAFGEYSKVELLYDYPVWQAVALLQAGKCCEKLGDNKEAARLYQRIQTSFPTTPSAKDAAERLQKLGKTKTP